MGEELDLLRIAMYGSWERALFPGLTKDEEILLRKRQQVKGFRCAQPSLAESLRFTIYAIRLFQLLARFQARHSSINFGAAHGYGCSRLR